MTPSFSALLWFAAILALIPLALWLLRRSPMGARLASGPMRQVGLLPLSASQKLHTIEVGQGDERRWLVLGVTPGSISLLYTLTPTSEPPGPPTTPAEGFAQLLSRIKSAGGDSRAN